jgi:hypothetical protein
MSLSTLLEAAKYLDYLDSNKGSSQSQHPTQSPPNFQQSQLTQPTIVKKTSRRPRSSKKDAANTMLAMSLPSSSGTIQMHQGVPIPLTSTNNHYQAASLSSSFNESPLSSFASTALLCSKASGVTSASSSAASSLSSSDSSSSCGEILMGDSDFRQSSSTSKNIKNQLSHNFTHQIQSTNNQPRLLNKLANDSNQSFSHYIAATSAGPQLVTMTTTSAGMTSASAPIESRLRTSHVIQSAANNSGISAKGFDPRHFSIATSSSLHRDAQYGHLGSSLGSDNHLSGSPGACQPLIMARVQPMILNSISPSAHQSIIAYQQQQTITSSSPTSSTSSYSRHRELHKTLEKNRRAHLRHCFEILKAELPDSDCVDKKTSHINIIKSAIKYVLALRQQECELDNELQRLIRVKNELTEKLSKVRNEHQSGGVASASPICMGMPSPLAPSSPNLTSQQKQSQSSPPHASSMFNMAANNTKLEKASNHQPPAEQQLSFLLSQSKLD